MKEKFKRIFEQITFPNGAEVGSRFAMAPMVIVGSEAGGAVGEEDLKYWERRNDSAALLITGATAVSEYSDAYGHGLGIYKDEQLESWKRLAEVMKAKGNLAVVQLFHAGYRSPFTYRDKGVVYGASTKKYDFLEYPVTGLTEDQIEEVLNDFAAAAKRVIEAGFDGIEIHGANRYLIQQFFSRISNERSDRWGGSLENRARFGIETVKRIQSVIKEHAYPGFILGYRISPEEAHRHGDGYTFDEALYLIDKVADLGVDYISTSQFGTRGFAATPKAGAYIDRPINAVVKEKLAGRALLMGAGDLTDPDKILEAVTDYADIAAAATILFLDPDTQTKIREGREDEVTLNVTERNIEALHIPKRFYTIAPLILTSEFIPGETKTLIYKSEA